MYSVDNNYFHPQANRIDAIPSEASYCDYQVFLNKYIYHTGKALP